MARSHAKYTAEKAALTARSRIFFAAPHSTRHAPLVTSDLLSFTIYPTCAADLAQNEFLWHAVHDASFTLSTGRRVVARRLAIAHPYLAGTPATLFALALPQPLAAFLEAVSLDEMHRSVIYMLADAAQGEDDDGLRNMRSTLAPQIWAALRRLLVRSSRDFANGVSCSNASFMLDTALQTAQAHDYWKIDVDAAIFLPATHSAFSSLTNHPRVASVLASLYADWATYAANQLVWEVSLPDSTRTHDARATQRRKLALHTMMRLISQQRQSETWQRVTELRRCAENRHSLFATLPPQIVEHLLVPRVVLDDACEHPADRVCVVEEHPHNLASKHDLDDPVVIQHAMEQVMEPPLEMPRLPST